MSKHYVDGDDDDDGQKKVEGIQLYPIPVCDNVNKMSVTDDHEK